MISRRRFLAHEAVTLLAAPSVDERAHIPALSAGSGVLAARSFRDASGNRTYGAL